MGVAVWGWVGFWFFIVYWGGCVCLLFMVYIIYFMCLPLIMRLYRRRVYTIILSFFYTWNCWCCGVGVAYSEILQCTKMYIVKQVFNIWLSYVVVLFNFFFFLVTKPTSSYVYEHVIYVWILYIYVWNLYIFPKIRVIFLWKLCIFLIFSYIFGTEKQWLFVMLRTVHECFIYTKQ